MTKPFMRFLKLTILLLFAGLPTIHGQEAVTDTAIIHRTAMDMRLVRLNFVYTSVGPDGRTPTTLSGAIIMRYSIWTKENHANGLIIYNHPTSCEKNGCPSRDNQLDAEAAIGFTHKYIIVAVDNYGFGITEDHPQAYLNPDVTAQGAIDGLLAAKRLLFLMGYEYENRLLNIGYSQGGHTAMAVQRLVDTRYSDRLKILHTYAGGGPYDIMGIYDEMKETGVTFYPCALPLILSGINETEGLGLSPHDMFRGALADHYEEWILSKEYSSTDINQMILDNVSPDDIVPSDPRDGVRLSAIINPDIMDETTPLGKRMKTYYQKNSLVGTWTPNPETHIYLFHSLSDEVVPAVCTYRMDSFLKQKGADVKTEYVNDWPHTPAAPYFFSQVALQMVRDTNKSTLLDKATDSLREVTDDIIDVLDNVFQGIGKLFR